MVAKAHNTPLSPQECRQLLAGSRFGRVAWVSAHGLLVLPVSYLVTGDRIAFRTSAGSSLAELTRPQPVSFEIDDLDPETQTGWSVLVQGTSGPGDPDAVVSTAAWVPGERPVVVVIEPSVYTGRAVAAD
ncbi:MAG: pyridoxamine 5'-phosphate oxidase family protein [Actinobacteria bacterium]|nr:pyridoxamine 5'-phosphate oxidase family protein [Actinomycetota bacterium]